MSRVLEVVYQQRGVTFLSLDDLDCLILIKSFGRQPNITFINK